MALSDKAKANRKEYMKKYRKTAKNIEYKKNHRAEHKESARASGIKHHRMIRLTVLTHYSGGEPKCACCKENNLEFLQVDHINNDGAEHRKLFRNSRDLYNWLIKNNFPEEFRVLCANCNFSRGAYGYCPHRNLSEDQKV